MSKTDGIHFYQLSTRICKDVAPTMSWGQKKEGEKNVQVAHTLAMRCVAAVANALDKSPADFTRACKVLQRIIELIPSLPKQDGFLESFVHKVTKNALNTLTSSNCHQIFYFLQNIYFHPQPFVFLQLVPRRNSCFSIPLACTLILPRDSPALHRSLRRQWSICGQTPTAWKK